MSACCCWISLALSSVVCWPSLLPNDFPLISRISSRSFLSVGDPVRRDQVRRGLVLDWGLLQMGKREIVMRRLACSQCSPDHLLAEFSQHTSSGNEKNQQLSRKFKLRLAQSFRLVQPNIKCCVDSLAFNSIARAMSGSLNVRASCKRASNRAVRFFHSLWVFPTKNERLAFVWRNNTLASFGAAAREYCQFVGGSIGY